MTARFVQTLMLALVSISAASRGAPASEPAEPKIEPPRVQPSSRREIDFCYSRFARRIGQEGNIQVKLTIEPDGRVNNVSYPAGAEQWQIQIAECVIKRLKFVPGKLDGVPVAAESTIPIRLRLEDDRGEVADIEEPRFRSAAEIEGAYHACFPADTLAVQITHYRITVGTDGRARHVRVVESGGDRALDEVGFCMLEQMKFIPARRDGKVVESTIILPLLIRPPR